MRVLGAYKTITVKELSQILHVTSGATTQHLDVLEKLGYIERTVNPGDRREACIDLTLSGKKKVGQICEFQYHLLSSLFEDIDDGELEMLVRVMQKVASKYTKERKNERE
jgi:DNA-binding MarR family transcriptional regulator